MVVVIGILFLVVPLIELSVIVWVSGEIGSSNTLLLLILFSAAGAWLTKRQGLETWRQIRDGLNAGKMPTKPLADGFSILMGGALLLTPGFLTDVVGLLMVSPPGRDLISRTILDRARRRFDPAQSTPGSARMRAGREHRRTSARSGSFRPDDRSGSGPESSWSAASGSGWSTAGGRGPSIDDDVIDVEWAEEQPVRDSRSTPVAEIEPDRDDPRSF